MADTIALVETLTTAPSSTDAFDRWIEQVDIVPFLRANLERGEFITYLSCTSALMNSVVLPRNDILQADTRELIDWDLRPTLSWSMDVIHSRGETELLVEPSSADSGKELLRNAERLIFSRSFDGREGSKHYIELLQKFTHIFDLHYVESRCAYCRLDARGDVEDVVRIRELPAKGDHWPTTIVTIDRMTLHEYLAATDSVLLVLFDFTRYRSGGFAGWNNGSASMTVSQNDIVYRHHVESGHASYMRGAQIIQPALSKAEVIGRHEYPPKQGREYASFIAVDWKNGAVKEISTAPDCLSNYFVKSDLPFELSPAFFRPEVLSKYKADTDKYTLEDRSISCRNSWSLQTYDRNEAGQVHTYLVYLQHLPYEEQLYWKSYNEAPKGPISKRAFTTDFEGQWHTGYDALPSLKQIASELDQRSVPWWTLRSRRLLSKVHYPVTSSADEWSSELLNLDQLVVEGFETRWLRQKAVSLGRAPDPKLQSLKLVEECLTGMGMDELDARKLTAPMHLLHALRSKLKGHASGEEATEIRKRALSEYGSYGKHFSNLCKECDESLRSVAVILKSVE